MRRRRSPSWPTALMRDAGRLEREARLTRMNKLPRIRPVHFIPLFVPLVLSQFQILPTKSIKSYNPQASVIYVSLVMNGMNGDCFKQLQKWSLMATRPQSSIQTPSHGGHKVLVSVPVPKPQTERVYS